MLRERGSCRDPELAKFALMCGCGRIPWTLANGRLVTRKALVA